MSNYDPSDHTVEEVRTYIEKHPDERDAIVEAEKGGKNRVTITDLSDDDTSDQKSPSRSGQTSGRVRSPEDAPGPEGEYPPGVGPYPTMSPGSMTREFRAENSLTEEELAANEARKSTKQEDVGTTPTTTREGGTA